MATRSESSAWFAVNGASIHYEAQGTGAPLLLLPGLAGSIGEFLPLRELLLAKGLRVIAADLPGSGASLPQPRQYHVDYHSEDSDRFVTLLQSLKATPAHLVGYSDGGDVALLMAVTHPEIVRSVILWGAFGALTDPDGEMVRFFATVVDEPVEWGMRFHNYLIENYGQEVARQSMQSVAGALQAILDQGGDISRSRARQIAAPVLLLAGEHDPFVPEDELRDLAARIPDAQLIIVPDARHALHLETPDVIAAAVDAFYTAIDGHRAAEH